MNDNKDNLVKRAWEMQATDTHKSFEAFNIYLNLGVNRSLSEVAYQLSKSVTLMQRWSASHNWVERVNQYDLYMYAKIREQKEKAILDMNDRQAKISMAIQNKMVQALNMIKPEDIKANEVARLMEVGMKYERIARGLLENNIVNINHITSNDPFKDLTTDELKRMLLN